IADADMTEAIEDLLVRQDTVGEDQIFDGGGVDAGKRARSGFSPREGERDTDRRRGHERKACLRRHGFSSELGQAVSLSLNFLAQPFTPTRAPRPPSPRAREPRPRRS